MLGSIAVGLKADLLIIDGDPDKPYDALLAATPNEVRLVLVGGVPLYGDGALKSLGPANPGCEDLGICTRCKFACVASSGGMPEDKLGQSYAEIDSVLSKGLTDYDALKLTAFDFPPNYAAR